jgi:carboxyl-terminal processing protease
MLTFLQWIRCINCRKDSILVRLVKITLVVVVVLVLTSGALGVGIAIGSSGLLANVDGALGLPRPLTVTEAPSGAGSPTGEPVEFDTFWQAWDIVYDKFIDRDALDETELEYGAIRGMIEALGDEGHTTFMTPEELERQRTDISGKFSGIGALLGVKDSLPVIIAPFDGSPADLAGVAAGDIIMEVDGQDVTAWTLSDIVDNIRGTEGTEVVLTLLRPEEGESLEIPITRGEITIPAATWAMLPGTDVALIRLSQFSANAEEQLVTAIREAEGTGASSLIVDVRNNPGGLLEQAIKVTSQFLEDGYVLQQEDAQGNRKPYRVKRGGLATEIPMVVLINQGSASSAEIFAGAIQDHERGTVVGETTFGTGTVLQPFVLDDGSGLMLGTSQWLTADGRLIRKQGIDPDITVELPMTADLLQPREVEGMTVADLLESEDVQLLKALELLGALPVEVQSEN